MKIEGKMKEKFDMFKDSRTNTHLKSSKCKTSTNSFSNGAITEFTATNLKRTTSKGTTGRM
jgi:hypothetical protein